jgi:2-polyprenyl-3-methyl-5-hydroxy-6-metoxy-1,4-benzoquinol methylase
MKESNSQSDFWDKYSKDFHAIYTHDKSGFQNLIDRVFRWDMYERYKFTIKQSQPISGKTVFDVGCGSGIYSMAFARLGAKKVTGIDYSKKMIELASKQLNKEKLQGNCEFQVSDIMNYETDLKFDISIAMGLFDYIKDPKPVLIKIRELTREKIIISFPRVNTLRAPVRKIRLMMKNLDVYFYSKSQLISLFDFMNIDDYNIEKIGKLYCVVLYL